MMKNKFTVGEGFDSVGELFTWLAEGNWVMSGSVDHRWRPVHPSWMISMRIETVLRQWKAGGLCKALRDAP